MATHSKRVLQAIAVTCELTGTQLSEAAARVFADDLAKYPEEQVLGSLSRCRREVRSKLTLADVIGRLDDGRPTPEQAWAMIPRDEGVTVVMTEDMAQAWGIARPLLDEGDQVAARMAFLESYRSIVMQARDAGVKPKWFPSIGHDKNGREAPLLDAVRKGLLKSDQVVGLLPHREDPTNEVLQLVEHLAKQITVTAQD